MRKRLAIPIRSLIISRSGLAAVVQTLLANVFILGITAGTGIITARLLGPSGRGELAAMIMWPQFLAFTLTLGVPSALLYNLKRYPGQASSLFSVALLLGTLMGLLATLVGVLFIPHWLIEYSPEVVRSAQWLMLIAPASVRSASHSCPLVLSMRKRVGISPPSTNSYIWC